MRQLNSSSGIRLAAVILLCGVSSELASLAEECPMTSFAAARTFELGALPQALALGDFNGDAKPDLVVSTVEPPMGPSRIRILLGNGDGTFRAGSTNRAGEGRQAVAVGDFDGNRQADLAVANHDSAKVHVLLGHGDGSFQNSVAYDTGNGPVSVLVGDLNGDGKPDLAVANSMVSILLSNGDGTFQKAANLSAGASPEELILGDFSHDKRPDLAVANSGFSGSIGVLLGKGDGTFPGFFLLTDQTVG